MAEIAKAYGVTDNTNKTSVDCQTIRGKENILLQVSLQTIVGVSLFTNLV